ncbi:ABC transporter permease [Paenibacillus mucilaginosus]|uniref:Binding-protein-dependent transport systems inner membrane component n=3 Tax=Paenibacillus mucilaginosus TaxID=61624 RepID=H6NAV6_9BACL|nr:ABC transporter permease subunit [Paenibacillus mucilaginosus]AEI42876.1 binding-protein-dependent transport systems inner membrane component [Paenibacillus mucilaginosus KNP414]AFC30582.1 binding-protein-dependent transport systems inner membrane component [Paenibacillus mucilaginosus 3016]AFH62888.1 sugar ABC transporter permease [Paenibacillus mucilaginosus K02]MCG7216503.1 ABC transporter permease subunit [Paenibacillus mucilaginosus]WDM31042.1 sugar ABC transporter permease [Paenibacil
MGMKLRRELPLHFMILPGLLFIVIFSYIPMAGIMIAFQKFIPAKGLFGDQKWIGWDNFEYVMNLPNFGQVLWNTLFIASLKLVLGLIVPIVFAVLLNEVKNEFVKRSVQTTIYLPYFLSWVVLGGILIDILSPSGGIMNSFLKAIGLPQVFFLGDNNWFPGTLIISDVWKNFGYGTIVYLAAITNIDPGLYEAATIDGANRWHKIWHITLPGMRMVIVLLSVLSLGQLLNAGFDQVFNLYSPQVYESGDILDTFVYRIGLLDAQYGVATAVGFFKSVVSLILISTSYFFAYKFAKYRIF